MAAQRWAIATDEDGYNAPVVKRVAFASTASQLKCPLCPESTDHGPFQCPYRKKLAKAFVTFNVSSLPKFHTALAATGPLGPYDVLLDSQSNTNAFHSRDLLRNLQQCEPFDLRGIADGSRIVTNMNGRCVGVDFGSIYFFPDATANVLSLSAVSRLYRVHYEQERNRFTIVVPGYPEDAFAFKEAHGGLHVCDFSFLLDAEEPAPVTFMTRSLHEDYEEHEDDEELSDGRRVTELSDDDILSSNCPRKARSVVDVGVVGRKASRKSRSTDVSVDDEDSPRKTRPVDG